MDNKDSDRLMPDPNVQQIPMASRGKGLATFHNDQLVHSDIAEGGKRVSGRYFNKAIDSMCVRLTELGGQVRWLHEAPDAGHDE